MSFRTTADGPFEVRVASEPDRFTELSARLLTPCAREVSVDDGFRDIATLYKTI